MIDDDEYSSVSDFDKQFEEVKDLRKERKVYGDRVMSTKNKYETK